MRTTLDLPDPLFRDLKIKAAQEGVSLKELLQRFVEKCLYEKPAPTPKPVRSPLPTPLSSRGGPPISLTNAEIEEIFIQEELERAGFKPQTGSTLGETEP